MESGYTVFQEPSDLKRSPFDRIPENAYWSTSSDRELKIHRIHAYPAKFPAFISMKALSFAQSRGFNVATVGDIFCGCGTVAFEARRSGIDFWGCDINPVATLIAKVKSNSYDGIKIRSYYLEILRRFGRTRTGVHFCQPAQARLEYWFTKKRFADLGRLLKAIQAVTPHQSRYRQFFLCAFSNILKPTSRWLTKSIKPQIDPTKHPSDVLNAFDTQVSFMINAWEEIDFTSASRVSIFNANVLELQQSPRLDMIVTSPPYVTSYEYADLHQLSTLWLGYASDYRHLRNGSIGSTQYDLNFTHEVQRLNCIGAEVVFSLFDHDKAAARATAKYFLDMQAVAARCFKLLNSKGLAVFVIGNTSYGGIHVNNAAHLVESLLDCGFSNIKVAKRRMSRKTLTPYRNALGQFSRSNTGRHVYAEEFVVIANK